MSEYFKTAWLTRLDFEKKSHHFCNYHGSHYCPAFINQEINETNTMQLKTELSLKGFSVMESALLVTDGFVLTGSFTLCFSYHSIVFEIFF